LFELKLREEGGWSARTLRGNMGMGERKGLLRLTVHSRVVGKKGGISIRRATTQGFTPRADHRERGKKREVE